MKPQSRTCAFLRYVGRCGVCVPNSAIGVSRYSICVVKTRKDRFHIPHVAIRGLNRHRTRRAEAVNTSTCLDFVSGISPRDRPTRRWSRRYSRRNRDSPLLWNHGEINFARYDRSRWLDFRPVGDLCSKVESLPLRLFPQQGWGVQTEPLPTPLLSGPNPTSSSDGWGGGT